jgi:hypothetical protein
MSSVESHVNALGVFLRVSLRILAWEDGFCNFAAASSSAAASACGQEGAAAAAAVAYAGDCEAAVQDAVKHQHQQAQGLQPELFFKMSHDIYNYGEG